MDVAELKAQKEKARDRFGNMIAVGAFAAACGVAALYSVYLAQRSSTTPSPETSQRTAFQTAASSPKPMTKKEIDALIFRSNAEAHALNAK